VPSDRTLTALRVRHWPRGTRGHRRRLLDDVLDAAEWFERIGTVELSATDSLPIAEHACRANPAPVLDKVMDGEAEARDDCRRGRRWEGQKRFRRADDRSRVGVRAIL